MYLDRQTRGGLHGYLENFVLGGLSDMEKKKTIERYEEWKKKGKDKNSTRKKRKRNRGLNSENCRNPLHFFPKNFDFTKQRPNRCKCSEYHRPPKRTVTRDIRSFTNTFPTLQSALYKATCSSQYRTHTDRIREHQDRLKRRKTHLI